MMNYKVYLVEDDENLNSILYSYLINEGFEVKTFNNGEIAMVSIAEKPHLWILDIMLPGIDGFELIKRIKKCDENTPVIFISARDEDIDRVLGLEMGSEDYLSKPFLPRELIIRVNKLLARVYNNFSKTDHQKLHNYIVDIDKRIVTFDGERLELSSKEFDLLLMFLNNKQRAFSREEILDYIWGNDHFGSDRAVDDLVRRLRKRMPELMIETVYGYGYRMNEK